MNLIPKDRAQLIALLQKQPTILVIDVIEGKPASLAEKLRSLKDINLTLIIMKYILLSNKYVYTLTLFGNYIGFNLKSVYKTCSRGSISQTKT